MGTNHPVINQLAISQPVVNQISHLEAVAVNRTSHPEVVVVNQTSHPEVVVVNQPETNQPETNQLSVVMTENGPNAKNQLPLKMDVSSARRILACSNVTKVSWLTAVVRPNVSRAKTEKLSLSIKHSDHVMHAQKKVAQNLTNQTSHPVVSQLVVNQTNHPVVNQLVISQLVISHQQVNARTSPPCSAKTLSLLLTVLKMTLVKWLVMSAAQKELCSWVKKARPEPLLSANAKDQNASGPIPRRRPSTVK